jgi:uncharacterized phage-like protein YoqJ
MKEKTVCFTGHRPEKLPGGGKGSTPLLQMLKSMLYYQIYSSAEEGYEYFISGLARGVDLWAAEYVLDIKKKFPDIKLICAKPFPSHGSNFKGADLYSLENVLSKADEVVCVSPEYSFDCYKKRNYYMVDRSSKLIAMVNNYKSGTGQTISYAKKQGLLMSVIDISKHDFGRFAENKKEVFLD